MGARERVVAIVALAAAGAVAATVGITYLQTRGESTTPRGSVTKPRAGAPPLELDFGLRDDAEARALARAETLYNEHRRAAAAKIFARYDSLEAQVGAAFAAWPAHGLDTMKRLVAANPHSALAELHLGLAYYWSGRNADAAAAFHRTETLQPDTPYALSAASILHPGMPPQPLPLFVPSSPQPSAPTIAALQRLARGRDVVARIYYGLALQRLGRRVSAERAFAAAAALAPDDPEALTAAAVGRFTKDHPERAFSRLGPLAKRFPRAAVVRFHLGYLLIWIGSRKLAAKELKLVVADAPTSVYARYSRTLLRGLEHATR
jgi:tetratricopeptide (TPR) repeat protein